MALESAPTRSRSASVAAAWGTVCLAHDSTLHRQVALKVLEPHRDDRSGHTRLLCEARSAAALSHPNICAVYENRRG